MPTLPAAARRLRSRVSRLGRANTPASVLQRLTVEQHGLRLRLSMTPRAGVRLLAIWGRGDDGWRRLAPLTPAADGLTADIDLASLAGAVSEAVVLHVEVERPVAPDSPAAELVAADADARRVDGGRTRYRTPLAEAAATELSRFHPVTVADQPLTPYLTGSGALAVRVGVELNPYGSLRVSLLRVHRGVVHLRGRLSTRHGHLTGATFVLRGRTSGHEALFPVTCRFDPERTAATSGLGFYDCVVRADCRDLLADERFGDDFYDAWLRITTEEHPEPHDVRIGRTPFLARYLTNSGWAERAGRAVVINPYYTFKAQRTSFQLSVLDADKYRFLRRELRLRHLQRLAHRRRDVWLIGERPYKAQDTGYHFFRYLRTAHPDVEAYYVVERDSPERANVAPLGNVLDHGSKEHIRTALLAGTVAGSHHLDFLYPLRTKRFRRAVRARRIFLQHGVMGTKWMANLYGKGVGTFEADLFIVSSEHEREYIVSDFGFEPDEVAVTGLSRFDALFAGDVPVRPGQVLVMPTWRDWLQDPTLFTESEYYQRWAQLLRDPGLRRVESRFGLEVLFCLHPNMQHLRHEFAGLPVRVVSQGEVDVQHLLKESAALITDYSSVGFDFSFLDKPVFYFQFDRERFLGEEGSHLDLDEELPGVITRTATDLLDALERSAADGFSMPAEFAARARRFLDHRDRANSERIYQAARQIRRRRDVRGKLAAWPVTAAGWRYLRRHRLYFPAMRLMYRMLLHLPADANLVLFESGLGRQYADSPRYIYEELVRRGSTMTKVWAYDRRVPSTDVHTKVVERLSPRYYYYLARSRYWVNNQSFPHYIRRRPDGVFVQTWHGTPLKRMLWDLDEVHGRDGGYLQRATDGAAQWSVLVSPSPFATKAIRSAFRFDGQVLELGYPRNDILHAADRDARAARIRQRLGLRPDQRVVLYAPTFRDDQTDGAGRFRFTLPFDLERLHRELGDDTVVLLRMHVLIRNAVRIPAELRDHVRDVSRYPEMQELYLASDVLITDYSSVFFDFAQLRRPTLFYAYDLATYRDKLRGFYLDYESDLPGPILETEDALVHALTHLEEVWSGYQDRLEAFISRFSPQDDGQAASRVVDAVFGPDEQPGQ